MTSVVVRCETLTRTATHTETAHVSLADLAIRRAIGVVGPKKLLFAVFKGGRGGRVRISNALTSYAVRKVIISDVLCRTADLEIRNFARCGLA